jgi:NAD(P)-dependent dehydrogenase (short-subunit alcohol dehydrogenase family)
MRLEGKTALITGGARGQGAAHGRRLAEEGAAVILGDILEDAGEAHARALRDAGHAVHFLRLDVTEPEDWAAAVQAAEDRCGRLDILVNNAGVVRVAPTVDETDDGWHTTMTVNATGVFYGMRAAIPAMRRNGGGSIVNVASFVAVMGAAVSQVSYTASKGGVLAMSRELGVEFARQGVRVNALCPGPVDTPLLRELFAKDQAAAARRLVHVPMGRFARAEEIANAALFLASDESSYVNASTFLVDGGISGAYVTPE